MFQTGFLAEIPGGGYTCLVHPGCSPQEGAMRFLIVSLAGMLGAQDLHLRGDRFKPLSYEQMTPEQKTMIDNVRSGERRSTDGPFNAYLRSPEMGDLAQKFGAYLRFHSSVPRKLNELAIIITARHWNAQFEWYAHRRYALEAGVSAATADAIAAGKRPPSL